MHLWAVLEESLDEVLNVSGSRGLIGFDACTSIHIKFASSVQLM